MEASSAAADAEPRHGLSASRNSRSRLLLAGVAAGVVVLDQLTKTLAQQNLTGHPVHIAGPLELRLEYNTGAAFSIGRGLGPALAVLAVLAVVAIWYATRASTSNVVAIGAGLVAGGALGNLTDRLLRHNGGAVIDFIHARYWFIHMRDWPTFNVADAAITCGVVLLVWSIVRRKPALERPG